MSNASTNLARAYLEEARRQFALCHQRLRHCLEQLDDRQLWHREAEQLNSIGNLVLHLTGNVRQRILSLVGGEPDARDRDAEFAERGPIGRDALARPLDEVLGRVDALLAELPAERLLEVHRYQMLRGEVEGNVLTLILQTLVHLGGHTQEIVTLTRRQLGDRYRFLQGPGRR